MRLSKGAAYNPLKGIPHREPWEIAAKGLLLKSRQADIPENFDTVYLAEHGYSAQTFKVLIRCVCLACNQLDLNPS